MEPEEERFPELPNELWIHVLFQGGPALLSPCSRLCKQLHQGIYAQSSELHRYYAQECFALTDCVRETRTDWREAFVQCCKQWRSRPALPAWAGRFLEMHSPYQVNLPALPIQPPAATMEPHPAGFATLLPQVARLLATSRLLATPLRTSVVAHTDQACEFESYGFPAANALRHTGDL